MQLLVNVANKAEIPAAIALLQLIAGHTFTVGETATPSVPAVLPMADNPAIGAPDAAAVFGNTTPAGPLPTIDAAAIFGASAAPLPGAPFTAAAGQFPNAPGALPVGLPATPNAASIFAPPIVQSVPAQTAPVTPPAAPAGVVIDADGLPWDERIHQSTKGMTTKGVYKIKKGFNNDALLESVKAELRARVGGTAPAAAPAAAPFVPPAASFQPVQPVASSAPAAPAELPTTWDAFMLRASAAMSAGILTGDGITAVCQQYQLPAVSALQSNPGHIPHVWSSLKMQYPALV